MSVKPNSALITHEQLQISAFKRNRIWMMTFADVFTALLTFFVLIMTVSEMETVPPKRAYQKVMTGLYNEVREIKHRDSLAWMEVENTYSKGIRITIDPELFASAPLFEPARADINPRYFPYLNELSRVLDELELNQINQRYESWVKMIEQAGFKVSFTMSIEGHTDAIPLSPGARYRDNIELSTHRAYELMQYLQARVDLEPSVYSMAGYGSFHPITNNPNDAENRRIELYLVPQMIEPVPVLEPEL